MSAVLTAPAASPRRDWGRLAQRWGAVAALIVLLLFNVLVTNNFVSVQTLDVNLTQVCNIVIVGTGMTLVIASGGIDLSVGSLMAISGSLAPLIFGAMMFSRVPYIGTALAFVVPVLVVGVFGLFNGFLVTRFRIQPIIATLILFIAGRGIAQVMTNGNLQTFHRPDFQYIGLGRPGRHSVPGYPDGPDRYRGGLGAREDAVRSAAAGGRRERECGAAVGRAGAVGQARRLHDQRAAGRGRGTDRHLDQLVGRREPGRARHGNSTRSRRSRSAARR